MIEGRKQKSKLVAVGKWAVGHWAELLHYCVQMVLLRLRTLESYVRCTVQASVKFKGEYGPLRYATTGITI